MTNGEAVNWLRNIAYDIGKAEHSDLWHYEQALSEIREMLEAQPETHEKRTETHGVCLDTISRQAAIDAILDMNVEHRVSWMDAVIDIIDELPSAQSEIVRCCQCKYAEIADKEDNQDGYTCQFHRGSVWFSGSYCSWAERREE